MAYVIPLIIIAVSAIGIAYIIARGARSLPEAQEELVYPAFNSGRDKITDIKDSTASNTLLGKIVAMRRGDALLLFMEKFFRKTRVRLMKAENFFNVLAERLHERIEKKRAVKISFHKKRVARSDKKGEVAHSPKKNNTAQVVFEATDPQFDEKYWLGLIEHDPGSVYPYRKLSEIYRAREDFTRARFMLRRVVRLASDNSWAQKQLEELKGKRTKK